MLFRAHDGIRQTVCTFIRSCFGLEELFGPLKQPFREVTWHTAKYGYPYFDPSKVHTHTAVNTHWRWRVLDIHSHHLQFLPDLRLGLATFRLWVRLSNIRPWLPPGQGFGFPFPFLLPTWTNSAFSNQSYNSLTFIIGLSNICIVLEFKSVFCFWSFFNKIHNTFGWYSDF